MPAFDEARTSALLASGKISAITIDTSIFDQKQLRLNSVALRSLYGLKERPFSFILSDTVRREVSKHLEKAAEDALRSAKKGIGDALFAFATEKPSRDNLLEQITRGREPRQIAQDRFAEFIVNTGCEVIDDADLVDTTKILDAYFAGRPPFGPGRKKDEFPDAFALNALERAAEVQNIGIIVVSADGDWQDFCKKSERLHLVPGIEKALALVSNAPLELRNSILSWMQEGAKGRKELERRIENSVENLEIAVYAFPSSGELETIPWGGSLEKLTWPEDHEIDIIDINEADDGVIQTTVSLPLSLIVRASVELNFSVWDSVDDEEVSMGGRTIEVDEQFEVRATAILDISNLGDGDERIDLVECELDRRNLHINLGEVDAFDHELRWGED